MDQNRIVNMILRDLKLMEIIGENKTGEIRPYLMALWTAGWENGIQEHNLKPGVSHGNSKPIGQFDKRGQLINTFKSRAEAVKITGFSDKGIRNSIYFEKATRQGWQWKFL